MMITLRISNRVVFVGSRVWFDKIDEYGVDSIFKANGMVTVFYGNLSWLRSLKILQKTPMLPVAKTLSM
jgi:hypothetical protein